MDPVTAAETGRVTHGDEGVTSSSENVSVARSLLDMLSIEVREVSSKLTRRRRGNRISAAVSGRRLVFPAGNGTRNERMVLPSGARRRHGNRISAAVSGRRLVFPPETACIAAAAAERKPHFRSSVWSSPSEQKSGLAITVF